MKTIGFVISEMKHEERRGILPKHIEKVNNKKQIFIEEGYGESLSISDEDYINVGVNVVSREEALKQDIICDLKVGRAQYLDQLSSNQTIFGWVHAESNPELVKLLVGRKLTVISWEDMYANGRHVFWRNNELAGEAAILHAFTLFGKSPSECHVALIGRGNVAMGAHKMLSALGAEVKIYNRDTVGELPNELESFDVIVNGVLWDKSRKDHLINKKDLTKLKRPAMIIDVSADDGGAIETSQSTTFNKPTYLVDGVIHYAVVHTPTIFHHSVSDSISSEVSKYVDKLLEGKTADNKTLSDATIIKDGKIMDEKLK